MNYHNDPRIQMKCHDCGKTLNEREQELMMRLRIPNFLPRCFPHYYQERDRRIKAITDKLAQNGGI